MAKRDVYSNINYIAQEASPNMAAKYYGRMKSHIQSLATLPDRNQLCRYFPFRKKRYLCSVFEETYIIAYTIKGKIVVIKRIIHGKRLI
jgi:plasmid stabilization system protein ParE